MNIETLLHNTEKYPHVFKIAADKPAGKGTWGGYKYDDVMSVWIDTSHPIAIDFFKKEREERMGYELTVQEQQSISTFLQQNQQRIADVLPPDVKPFLTPSMLTQIAYQALVENPMVGRCEPASIVNAIIGAASMGLQIGGQLGQASLVPFKNRAKLMVEWRGYMAYANKTGKVRDWFVSLVYENEEFRISGGNNRSIIHSPIIGKNKGKLVAAYAMCRIAGDDRDKFVIIDEDEAERIKAHSAANRKADSPWNTQDVGRMWLKTAVKQLCRTYLLALSPDMAKILSVDDQVEIETDQFDYIKDVTSQPQKPIDVSPPPDENRPVTKETRQLLFTKMTAAGIAKQDMEAFYNFVLQKQKPTERWAKSFIDSFDMCLKAWQVRNPPRQEQPPVEPQPAESVTEPPPSEQTTPAEEASQTKEILPNVQKHLAVMKEENPDGYMEACAMLDVDALAEHDDITAQEILSAMSVTVDTDKF